MLWKVKPDPRRPACFVLVEADYAIEGMPAFVGAYYRRANQRFVMTAAQRRKAERLIDAGWRSEANRYVEPSAWHPDVERVWWHPEDLPDMLAMCPAESLRCRKTKELALC